MKEVKSLFGGRKILCETYEEFREVLSREGSNVWSSGVDFDRNTFTEYYYLLLKRSQDYEQTLVGKTLKSKINGALFFVEEEITEKDGRKYYIIRDEASGNKFCHGKEWFERGTMQNLVILQDPS